MGVLWHGPGVNMALVSGEDDQPILFPMGRDLFN